MLDEAGRQTTEQRVDKHASNVVWALRGQTADTIVVGAHFDFAAEHGGKGIVDDWSGASLLVSLYQTLKQSPRHHTYQFVAFAREEDGLIGSAKYVKDLSPTDRTNIKAFVNLECLGLDEPKVWGARADRRLLVDLVRVSKAVNVPLEGVSVDYVGDDDSHPFLNKKIPVITVHSLTQNTLPILHSSRDRFSVVNEKFYYDAYRLTAFFLTSLDQAIKD